MSKLIQHKVIIFILLGTVFILFATTNLVWAESESKVDWRSIAQKNYRTVDNLKAEVNSLDLIIAQYELAVCYANLGLIKRGSELFDKLGDKDAKDKLDIIIAIYEKQYQEAEDDFENMNYLAFAYYIDDNYEAAEEIFEKIVELDSDNIWSYNYLAVVKYELEKYDEADAVLKTSMEIESNYYTHFLMGVNYYELGSSLKATYHLARGRRAVNLFF